VVIESSYMPRNRAKVALANLFYRARGHFV
jgi:hypothetical protein